MIVLVSCLQRRPSAPGCRGHGYEYHRDIRGTVASRTVVELFDDLDGGRADETVSFALDGVDYEIDLSSDNAAGLRSVLAEYMRHAHRAPGKAAAKPRPVKPAPVAAVVAVSPPKPVKPVKSGKPAAGSNADVTAEIRRLASESAKKASEAAASAEAEAETFEVPEVPAPGRPAPERQQEQVRALVIPFQEAGL